MKILNKIIAFAGCLLVGITFVSCDTDDPKGVIPGSALQDFVTIASRGSHSMTFTFRQSGDSPEIVLTSTSIIPDGELTHVGDRVVIAYMPEGVTAYTSGSIQLYGFIRCYQGNAGIGTEDQFKQTMLATPTVTQIWRSGDYINMVGYVRAINKPENIMLVGNPSTQSDDMPEMRLAVMSADVTGDPTRIAVYGSWNISSIRDLLGKKGIIINYESPNGPVTKNILFNQD